jgi:hypothetical protein
MSPIMIFDSGAAAAAGASTPTDGGGGGGSSEQQETTRQQLQLRYALGTPASKNGLFSHLCTKVIFFTETGSGQT